VNDRRVLGLLAILTGFEAEKELRRRATLPKPRVAATRQHAAHG